MNISLYKIISIFSVAILLMQSGYCFSSNHKASRLSDSEIINLSTVQGINLLYGGVKPDIFLEKFGKTKVVDLGDDKHSSFWLCYVSKVDKTAMLVRGRRMVEKYVDFVKLIKDVDSDAYLSKVVSTCLIVERSFIDVKFGNNISLNTKTSEIIESLGKGVVINNSTITLESKGIAMSPNMKPRLVRGEYYNDAILYRVVFEAYGDKDYPDSLQIFIASEGMTLPVKE